MRGVRAGWSPDEILPDGPFWPKTENGVIEKSSTCTPLTLENRMAKNVEQERNDARLSRASRTPYTFQRNQISAGRIRMLILGEQKKKNSALPRLHSCASPVKSTTYNNSNHHEVFASSTLLTCGRSCGCGCFHQRTVQR
jgi:hypothetical protein